MGRYDERIKVDELANEKASFPEDYLVACPLRQESCGYQKRGWMWSYK
jgi:hypothetical protein